MRQPPTILLRTFVYVEGNAPYELYELQIASRAQFEAAMVENEKRGHKVDRQGDKYDVAYAGGKMRVVYNLTFIE